MLHNPIVLPADVAVGFWLKPVAPGIMPVTAAQRRQRIPGALVDAGCWIPGRMAACAG
jgi:hypothetical protein